MPNKCVRATGPELQQLSQRFFLLLLITFTANRPCLHLAKLMNQTTAERIRETGGLGKGGDRQRTKGRQGFRPSFKLL